MLSKTIIDKLRTSLISFINIIFFYYHYEIFIFMNKRNDFLEIFLKFINFLVQVFFSYIDYIQKDSKFCIFHDNWLIFTNFRNSPFPLTVTYTGTADYNSSSPLTLTRLHLTPTPPEPKRTDKRHCQVYIWREILTLHRFDLDSDEVGSGRTRSGILGFIEWDLSWRFFCNGVNNGRSDGPTWHLLKCLGSEV